MATISNTPRPGYVWDSTDNVWYPIGVGGHSHPDYITQATAISPTTVDAKGDLLVGSAADTISRLAVGADGSSIVADSATATGLAYKSAATLYPWTTYTPSYGALTIGNGTVIARYQKIGKLVNYYFKFTLGSTSAVAGGAFFTTPSTPAQVHETGELLFRDSGTAWWFGKAIVDNGAVYLNNMRTVTNFSQSETIDNTSPFTWTTNDFIVATGSYEEA